jgi:CBS domain containing-hemolysin-like protein
MLALFIMLLTISFMVFATGFYVAAEFSVVSARKTRITQIANAGSRPAKMLLSVMEDIQALNRYVAATQVGISIFSLVLGAYGQNTVATALTPLLIRLSLDNLTKPVALSISVTGVLFFLTIAQVILGELLPKSLTIHYPERVGLATVIPMNWSLALFRPLIWFFDGTANLIIKLVGASRIVEDYAQVHSPGEIELLVSESHQGGLLADEAQQMLRNTLRLRELTARQVMAPRIRLLAASVQSTVDELINKACAAGYTRIPLYQSTIDDIVGFVHLKDLFRLHLQQQPDPKKAIREVVYVPENLPFVNVWATMKKNRQYIAIVLDEYGGTAGLITYEDLIEEIFGELLDEFDDELPLISSDKEGRIHLRSDLLVTDVNEYLELDLPDDEMGTLGGLVFGELGRLPRVGDEVTFARLGVTIRVEAMEARRISEVSLYLPTDVQPHINEWKVPPHE